MSDKFQNQAILVYYPCGAGGKFIINSLGLSRHCVPHDPELAIWDLPQTVFDQLYYQTKLDQVLNTVPPIHDLDNWQKYELGVYDKWLNPVDFSAKSRLNNIINADRYFCLIGHSPEDLQKYLNRYPNINIVKLTNYCQWLKRSSFKILELKNDVENKVDYWNYIDQQ